MKILTLLSVLCFLKSSASKDQYFKLKDSQHFQLDYQWTYINYTWESPQAYQDAITSKKYIPENGAMAGIKYYQNKMYIALPRICHGTPVTLAYISLEDNTPKSNPLLTPYPSWTINDLETDSCEVLENVQSMEIDSNGIMWVIDGFRNSFTKCPPKLVWINLNTSEILKIYEFPEEISSRTTGFLNDLVIDETDGGFAYITDHSSVDPGLIIYSCKKNQSWKIRDSSMFAEIKNVNFIVDEVKFENLAPIDGIALTPLINNKTKYLVYCPLTGLKLYSIDTKILKDQELVSGGNWRFNVSLIGEKQAQTDGMVFDNLGNLYYGLLPLYGVGHWDSTKNFSEIEILDQNRDLMIWTDSFSFDDKGYLYLLANNIHKYFITTCNFQNSTEYVKFRILKYFTNTKSYLY